MAISLGILTQHFQTNPSSNTPQWPSWWYLEWTSQWLPLEFQHCLHVCTNHRQTFNGPRWRQMENNPHPTWWHHPMANELRWFFFQKNVLPSGKLVHRYRYEREPMVSPGKHEDMRDVHWCSLMFIYCPQYLLICICMLVYPKVAKVHQLAKKKNSFTYHRQTRRRWKTKRRFQRVTRRTSPWFPRVWPGSRDTSLPPCIDRSGVSRFVFFFAPVVTGKP